MKIPKRYRNGFTLIEMVIVVALIGTLIYIIIPTERPDTAPLELKTDYLQIEMALNNYRTQHGDYPATALGLPVLYKQVAGAPDGWKQYIRKQKFIKGPNKKVYYYEYSAEAFPKVVYLGSDNALGGEGRAADIDLAQLSDEE